MPVWRTGPEFAQISSALLLSLQLSPNEVPLLDFSLCIHFVGEFKSVESSDYTPYNSVFFTFHVKVAASGALFESFRRKCSAKVPELEK